VVGAEYVQHANRMAGAPVNQGYGSYPLYGTPPQTNGAPPAPARAPLGQRIVGVFRNPWVTLVLGAGLVGGLWFYKDVYLPGKKS